MWVDTEAELVQFDEPDVYPKSWGFFYVPGHVFLTWRLFGVITYKQKCTAVKDIYRAVLCYVGTKGANTLIYTKV